MSDPTELRLIDLATALPVDDAAFEGVPDHLDEPLRSWAATYVDWTPGLRDRRALRLRRPPLRANLLEVGGMELLRLISFALQMTTDRLVLDSAERQDATWSNGAATPQVMALQAILTEGGSAYTVSWDEPAQLVRRLDPAVTEGIAQTLASADATSTTFLRRALQHVYGLHPDPEAAYRAAVKAVEEVGGFLVLPSDGKPQIGKVVKCLEDAPAKWSFTLAGYQGDTPEPVTVLMRRLIAGEVSRHTGGKHNRDTTQAEAEAAVHVAILLVQLISTKALARRDTT